MTIDQPLKQQCTNLCLRSKRGQLTCKALEETKSSTAVGGSSSSSATQHQTCANSPAASPKQTSHSPTSSPKQTSNTTSYSPAPSPISTTPNSPKPVSPTPSLLFRSREASSDGSTSPCKEGSFLIIVYWSWYRKKSFPLWQFIAINCHHTVTRVEITSATKYHLNIQIFFLTISTNHRFS